MCCCIPLRQLSILGTCSHVFLGCLYMYFLFSVIYGSVDKYRQPDTNKFSLLYNGIFISLYFLLFLPFGILVLTAVYKKLKILLKASALAIFLLQVYGVFVQSYAISIVSLYSWTSFPDRYVSASIQELIIYNTMMIIYLFTLFFYSRELNDDGGLVLEEPMGQLNPQTSMFGGSMATGQRLGQSGSQSGRYHNYDYADVVLYRPNALDESRALEMNNSRNMSSIEY